ncbi:MAG: DUF1080 domain-containing protein [Bacteroides sp.]|nr:DUF1080 domain-containing protein [Bacteroides sp.]MDD2646257.1 DUF1080 domain-containing protein [Bacteroides sp.]MDD4055958.1 DUF1080 domain-containing protein [Bacteroides sp.]NLI64680.1 DUF1080 domain-containing protein [Bacteroidales bacterium]
MKKNTLLLTLLILSTTVFAQTKPQETEYYNPQPAKVIPGDYSYTTAPSDAIILFDGKDISAWESQDGKEPQWNVKNGELLVQPGTGSIKTKQYFGDVQLHIEYKSPDPEKYSGQNRGNSGVFFQSKYEIQILDMDNNKTYVNGMAGSVYKQNPPLADAYTKNGEWQVYDIIWKSPVFGTNGKLEKPAMITVLFNGIVVQNNFILEGTTEYIGFPKYEAHGRLPLMLQDHGTSVAFRNIWVRELN